MRDRSVGGACSRCDGAQLTCTYNFFDRNALVIHSWEHKCPDCGLRQTTAYRSDDEELDMAAVNPAVCPYCSREPGGE